MRVLDRASPLRVQGALVLLVLGWFVLSAPWLVFGRVVPFDSKDQFYPALSFASESLRSGELPFWNPYIYAGYPSVSDPQSLMFSPVALLLMVAVDGPSLHWFDAIELIHLLMGGVGMLLLVVRFGYSPTAGLYSAAVYMFGGSAAGRMQHVPIIYAYGYFPWALLALDAMLETRRLRWTLGFGVLAGVMAAHQNQVAYLFSLVLLGYALYRVLSSGSPLEFLKSRLWGLTVGGFTGALVLAVPVYATLQFLPMSNRIRIPLDVGGGNFLHPLSWATLFVQGFLGHRDPSGYWGFGDLTETWLYLGALPLVILLACPPAAVSSDRRFRFFSVVGALALLYSLGNLTPFYGFFYEFVPGVSLYRRPADASFVVNMVLALATGFGIERLLSGSTNPRRRAVVAAIVVSTAGFMAWATLQAARQHRLASIYPEVLNALVWIAIACVLLGLAVRFRGQRHPIAWAGLIFLAADLGVHSVGTRLNADRTESFAALSGNPGSVTRFLQEGTSFRNAGGPYRAEFVAAGSLWANAVPTVFGIQSSQGYNPLRYGLYERAAGAVENAESSRPFPPMLPDYDAPMLDLLGVRYIVSTGSITAIDAKSDEGRFPPVAAGEVQVWENTNPLPRVVTATAIYLEPDLEAAIDGGRVAPIDYRSTVVLDHGPPTLEMASKGSEIVLPLPGEGEATAEITSYTNTRVEVRVESERDTILVLHDLYYPYWTVTVDGEERELLRANYLFRGVHVAPGSHRVVFRFRPFAWTSVGETLSRYLEARRAAQQTRPEQLPEVTSVSPARGNGTARKFVFRFSDPDGYQDLARQTILFNDTLATPNGCYLYHEGDTIQLGQDDGVGWQGPITLGTEASLENSQCRIDALGSSVEGNGNSLSLTLDLTFFEDFEGIQAIWAYAQDRRSNTAFGEIGRWAVWSEPPSLTERIRFLLGLPESEEAPGP